MIDFLLYGGFVMDGRTDRQTNERTLVVVESLSQLQKFTSVIVAQPSCSPTSLLYIF